MTYRKSMQQRPWLDKVLYDKYDTPNCIHFDLYSYSDAQGEIYFNAIASERGKRVLGSSAWRFDPFSLALDLLDETPDALAPRYWTRATHHAFKTVHGRLLAMCVAPRGYSAKTVLAHYVRPYDADPWPRSTVNTYAPPVYGDGKRPGRPRTVATRTLDTASEL